MYIAMNTFSVIKEHANDFESVWKTRNSYLNDVNGFLEFHLLRSEDDVFVSFSKWQSKNAFDAWTKSDEFKKAHSEGPSVRHMLDGHPKISTYKVVI